LLLKQLHLTFKELDVKPTSIAIYKFTAAKEDIVFEAVEVGQLCEVKNLIVGKLDPSADRSCK
jgi:hypothetical protein